MNRLSNKDIMIDDLSDLMQGIKSDVMYVDPPWGERNLKYWRTMNKQKGHPVDWLKFLHRLKYIYDKWCGKDLFIETGINYENDIKLIFGNTENMFITKYKSGNKYYPALLLVYAKKFKTELLNKGGYDLVYNCLKNYENKSVFDPCIGKGLTAKVGRKLNMNIFGNELNLNRLNKTAKILGCEIC